MNLIINWWNILVLGFGLGITFWCNNRYNNTKSRPLLTSLPGVWTSLGLLGTFCAICLSLHNFNTTGEKDLDVLELIRKLVPAFTTSIIGLLSALIVTIWSKMRFAREEVEDDSKLGNMTPEEYIRDTADYTKMLVDYRSIWNKHNELLSELIRLHMEEEEKNREYNNNLNENISHQSEILKEFVDGFVNRMDEIFKQMHGAIQQQVQSFGEEQFTKTSQILTSITERLSNVSNDIINNQRQSVETMMTNTNTEIGAITTSVTEVLSNLTSKVQESLTALNTQQSDRLNTIITNYDTLANKLSEQNTDFANKLTQQLQTEYSKVQEHNVQSLQQMVDLKTAYQEATSNVLTSTLTMNEKATADLRESMTGFVANIQNLISAQCSTLSTAISTNVESLNSAYKFIESLVAEIRQNYDQSVLAYGDAVSVAHRTNESSEKLIAANNKSLQAVEETNNKISEILDILEERQVNIEQLTKQISSVSGAILELQKLESMLNKITCNK